MTRILLILSLIFSSIGASKASVGDLFDEDFDRIDAEFAKLDSVEASILSGDSFDIADFELPSDSSGQEGVFPILGIPTFWLVFIPSCAASCCTLSPVGGSCVGLLSAGYIYHFTEDEEETRQALLGCAVAQIPTVAGLAAYYALIIGTF